MTFHMNQNSLTAVITMNKIYFELVKLQLIWFKELVNLHD